MAIRFTAAPVGDRVALIRDETLRAIVSELTLPAATLLRDQLDSAIASAKELGR